MNFRDILRPLGIIERATSRELASRLFRPANEISNDLRRLRRMGFVKADRENDGALQDGELESIIKGSSTVTTSQSRARAKYNLPELIKQLEKGAQKEHPWKLSATEGGNG